MRDGLRRALRLSSAAFMFTAYFALLSTNLYPTLLLLVPAFLAAFAPTAERLDATHPAYRAVTKALTIAYICFLPLTAIHLGLLNSVIALIFYVQAFAMLHRKNARSYYYLFLMNLFLLLAACVQSPEPVIGVIILLFLSCATWSIACLRLYLERNEVRGRKNAAVTGLNAGELEEEQSDSHDFSAGLATAIAVVTLAVVFCTVLLFVGTPRIEAGLLGRREVQIEAQTGLSQTMDLFGGGLIQQDPTPVMHVRFPDAPNGQYDEEALYWRCATLSKYNGSSWREAEMLFDYEPFGARNSGQSDSDPKTLSRERRPGMGLVRQEIFVDHVPAPGVPCLDLVQRIELTGASKTASIEWSSAKDWSVLFNAGASPPRISYEVWSEVADATPEELRKAPTSYTVVDADYALLTEQDLLPETLELVEEIVAGHENVYDEAKAIEAWLSGPDFVYSLNVPKLPPEHAIDAFLNNFRRGHCQLFASAMALMMRSLGVPARVVTGYRGGEFDVSDQSFIVREQQAHLWVEVLISEYGWVRFDPSPTGELGELSNLGKLRAAVQKLGLQAKMFWYQEVEGFDRGLQIDRLRQFSIGFVQGLKDLDPWNNADDTGSGGGIALLPLLAMVFSVIVLVMLFRGRSRTRRVQRLLTEDQARAILLHSKLRRHLRRYGIRTDNKTVEELRAEIRSRPWTDIIPAELALDRYSQSRFGTRPLPKSEFARLKQGLRALRPSQA